MAFWNKKPQYFNVITLHLIKKWDCLFYVYNGRLCSTATQNNKNTERQIGYLFLQSRNKAGSSKEMKSNECKIYKIKQDFCLFLFFHKMSNQTLEVIWSSKPLSISALFFFLSQCL